MAWRLPNILNINTSWLEKQQTTILSAATVIGAANIASLLAGLLRERILIATYFDTELSQQAYEAFKIAFQIPSMLFQIVVLGALSATLVPLFTELKKKNPDLAFKSSSVILNYILLVFIVFSALIFVFAEPITRLRTGSAFTPEQVAIVTNLTRVMLLAQLSFAFSNFVTGILQSYQRFVLPAIAPILYNVGIVLGVLVLEPMFGIYAAGLGVVIGSILHILIQLPLLLKLGFRYSLSFDINLPAVKEFIWLAPPRTLALSLNELRKLVLAFLATSIGGLAFLIMDYALMLMVIPIRFVGVPISQASLPFLADQASQRDRKQFVSLVLQSIHQIAFLSYPASVLILILRVPLVRLVFGTANFPWETTRFTGRVLAILAISITAQAVVQLLIRAFYALKDTKTPLLVTSLDFMLYAALGLWLVLGTNFGVYGLALATALTALLEFAILIVLLHRKIGGFLTKAFWLPQLKMITASFLMAVFLYLPYKLLDEHVFDTTRTIELISFTITTSTIGILVYIYFALVFKIKEFDRVVGLVSNFVPWQKTLAKSQEVLVDRTAESSDTI